MLTLQALKSELRGLHNIRRITVSVGEYDNEYDVNVNVWYFDRYYNDLFESYLRDTLTDERKAVTLAKRTATSLKNVHGLMNKVEYVGIENC